MKLEKVGSVKNLDREFDLWFIAFVEHRFTLRINFRKTSSETLIRRANNPVLLQQIENPKAAPDAIPETAVVKENRGAVFEKIETGTVRQVARNE